MSQTTEPRQTDRRRTEIAAAARSLIAEQGFEGLRTRDLAGRGEESVNTRSMGAAVVDRLAS